MSGAAGESPSVAAETSARGGSQAAARAHPNWKIYLLIGVVLTVVTAAEIAVFYITALRPVLVPTLLTLSAGKFALVAMFYMHLRFDSRLFSFVFVAPLMLAVLVVTALVILFHVLPRGML